jgi:ferrous iron transport protein B
VIELGLPVVVALNMVDQLEQTGDEIDEALLAEELGVPVVPVVASRGRGMDELRAALAAVLEDPAKGSPDWRWEPGNGQLGTDVAHVEALLPDAWWEGDARRRKALALWALLSIDDADELDAIPEALRRGVSERRELAERDGREIDLAVIGGRYEWIDRRADRFLRSKPVPESFTDRIDRFLLHPGLGFGVFLALMAVVFQSLFTWADPAIGVIEDTVAAVGGWVEVVLPAGFFTDLLVSGVIGGVGSVLVFLPQILLLFFFIGLMEDTGYMARVAFLMDRTMKSIGLHGRAFVPMLSGFACAIPAILATRTMERRRDRMLTMMVVPLMTCSARLPVYGLLIAALYPPDADAPFAQGLLMVAMYVFSTVLALACAAVLGRTVFKGPRVPLILEMPPYRMPHWPSVVRMMWQRSRTFIQEAGTVILACTIGMWLLLTYPKVPEGTGPETGAAIETIETADNGTHVRESYAGRLGRFIEPVLEPLGFDWKIGVGLIGAFAAREVFVSTMAVVYDLSEEEDETSTALRERIRAQRRPDGSKVFTPLTCFSLMVFFALACQCMSTLAVVKRETHSWLWPLFLFAYMTALAWVASFVVYQGGQLIGFE